VSGALERRIRAFDLGASWGARKANWAHMGAWIVLFAAMSILPYPSEGMHFLGADHPGKSIEFWEQGCTEGRYHACHNLVTELGISCKDQVGPACLMQGEMYADGRGATRDPLMSAQRFGEACYLGANEACSRLGQFMQTGGDKQLQQACDGGDSNSCVALGAVYRKGIGTGRDPVRALALFEAACRFGSSRGCGLAGQSYLYGDGVAVDDAEALAHLDRSCHHDYGPGCVDAGMMYRSGKGVGADETIALERFRAACDLGVARACNPDELPSPFASIADRP
jgi:TPR repeat protein